MVELPLQLQRDRKTLAVLSQEDADRLLEFLPNQILRAKITGVKKPRSVRQLNLHWKACSVAASNLEGYTKEGVDFETKIKVAQNHPEIIKRFKMVDGITYIEPISISFANLAHLEACKYFKYSMPIIAKSIGLTEDELVSNIKKGLY